jgi:HSP20 family protein
MNPYEEDCKNKEFIEDLFEKIFESVRKMYRNDNLEDFIQDTNDDRFGLNGNFVQNFGANITPHTEINDPELENDRSMTLEERHEKSEKSEFSTDIIETDGEIFVTVNIPGAEKEDIGLNVTEVSLEIIINTPEVKYHKIHKLPCNVKPKETIASYKNGVLDVVMKRKEKKNTEGKYKANID